MIQLMLLMAFLVPVGAATHVRSGQSFDVTVAQDISINDANASQPAASPAAKPTPGLLPVQPTPEPGASPSPEPKATATPKAVASPEPAGKADIKLTALNHGKTIAAVVGQKIVVTLSGNPTTGFSWNLSKLDGASVKQVGKMEYVQDDAAKGKVGVGGKFTFTFEATKAGKSALNFEYKRPFEKTVDSVVNFTVDVKE